MARGDRVARRSGGVRRAPPARDVRHRPQATGIDLPANIDPLAGVPSLEALHPNSPGPLATLAPLAGLSNLTILGVVRCPKLRSIDSLAALPLETLRLKTTGVKQVPEALLGALEDEDEDDD